MITLKINGKSVTVTEGASVLDAALSNGIYIPNLCTLPGMAAPPASCRLCFVEVEGYRKPVTACTERVRQGLVVNTRGTDALRLARTAAELLLASHNIECAHCVVNRKCELQKIAANLGIKLNTKRFQKLVSLLPIDSSSPLFSYDPAKCVLCGRCVHVCRERMGIGAIGFARRGFDRTVAAFGGEPIAASICTQCGECVPVCPAGALTYKAK